MSDRLRVASRVMLVNRREPRDIRASHVVVEMPQRATVQERRRGSRGVGQISAGGSVGQDRLHGCVHAFLTGQQLPLQLST
jgi:hypothetical protein